MTTKIEYYYCEQCGTISEHEQTGGKCNYCGKKVKPIMIAKR